MATPLPSNVDEIGYTPPEETTFEEIDARSGQHLSQINSGNASHIATSSNLKLHMPSKSVSSGSQIWSKKFGGVTAASIIQLLVILVILTETIVGWVFAALSAQAISDIDPKDSAIASGLIHTIFGIAVAIALIFLKHRISCIRAERYAYTHKGEIPLYVVDATQVYDALSDAMNIGMIIDTAVMT